MFEHIQNCDGALDIAKNGRHTDAQLHAPSENQVIKANQNRRQTIAAKFVDANTTEGITAGFSSLGNKNSEFPKELYIF
jgi:hypothetical protein